MNCAHFEQLLDHLLEGSLPPDVRHDAQDHLGECPRCLQLMQVISEEQNPMPEELSSDLASAILDRTSGRTCSRALDLACDLVDGKLGTEERQLVASHLEHCPACSAMVGTLLELKRSLPEMAELEPPRTLTGRVLMATSARRPAARIPESRFMERLRAWAQQPRFSLEAAYLGTLLLVALLGNPAAVLNKTSPVVLSMVQVDIPGTWNAAVRNVPPGWIDFGRTSLAESGARVGKAWQAGVASGSAMVGVLQGDERYWGVMISALYSRAHSSLENAASLVRGAIGSPFATSATESTTGDRKK